MKSSYLFSTERLGFRTWQEKDHEAFIAMNQDPEVMHFFPTSLSEKESIRFIDKMMNLYTEKGYCYFAVDELKSEEFIGFIGLSEKTFEASFTPCIDIGWRLRKVFWGKGYATEGAIKCLQQGFNQWNISSVKSIAPVINLPSIRIMQKIGMQKIEEFQHPLLLNNQRLVNCVCYEIHRS